MVPLLLGSLNSKSNLLHNAIKIIGFFMLVSGGVVMTLSMPLWVVIIAIIDGLIIFIFGVGGKTNRFSGRPIWDEHNSTTGRGVLIPHAPVWTDDPGGWVTWQSASLRYHSSSLTSLRLVLPLLVSLSMHSHGNSGRKSLSGNK